MCPNIVLQSHHETVSKWTQSASRYSQPDDTVSQWIQSASGYSQPDDTVSQCHSQPVDTVTPRNSQSMDTVSQTIQSASGYSQPDDTVSQWIRSASGHSGELLKLEALRGRLGM